VAPGRDLEVARDCRSVAALAGLLQTVTRVLS
jgi:hypothetical protein